MSVAISAGVVAGASAAAASASAAASRARDAECRSVLKTFDAQAATPGQQLNYAECVQRFQPPNPSDIVAMKVVVAAVLVAMIAGGAIGAWRDLLVGEGAPVMMGAVGAALGFVAAIVGAGIIAAAWFVLS